MQTGWVLTTMRINISVIWIVGTPRQWPQDLPATTHIQYLHYLDHWSEQFLNGTSAHKRPFHAIHMLLLRDYKREISNSCKNTDVKPRLWS